MAEKKIRVAKTSRETLLTFDRAKQLLAYEPETGHLRWLKSRISFAGKAKAGSIAGQPHEGYIVVGTDGVMRRAHRVAWLLMTGAFPEFGIDIDHINGDRSDNRWANLRLATRTQNNMNLPVRCDNKSGHRGISWRSDTKKWHARIVVSGRTILLGNFHDLEAAVAARVSAETHHFGKYSYLKRKD